MKHLFLIGIALTLCMCQSKAQIRMPGSVSGGHTDATAIGGTSIVIGTSLSTASSNVIIGNGTGNLNTAGGNVFVGQAAATANTTGYANAFFGTWSGGANNSGYANTFIGHWSGPVNTTGNHNVFVGQGAAPVNTTGGDNSFMGQGAGWNNTTGYFNTFIGKAAGIGNTSGYSNTALGKDAGFLVGNLINSTVIGANAQSNASNTVILGGTGTNAVNVGVGTTAPSAHLHTVNEQPENVLFSTTNTGGASASTVKLRTPSAPYPNNDLMLFMNANSYSGTFLPAILANSAPNIPNAHIAGLLTDGSPLSIGVDGYEIGKTGPIHFINWVSNSGGSHSRTECMRISNTTGFVGVHTRQAATASGTGSPQALFHVNLTNPINSSLNTLTQGIRFEGLPTATPAHTQTVVIDANGNLAKGSGTVGPTNAWLLNGNNILPSPGSFIGTLDADDFRMRTNNVQRARITVDGNFDFGGNTTTLGTTTSAAIGTNNTLNVSTSAIIAGKDNSINNSVYSAAFGENNVIDVNSISCQATGNDNNINDADYSMTAGNNNNTNMSVGAFTGGSYNTIDNSTQVAVLGGGHTMDNTFASVITGEDNEMYNGHGCFMGGGHSYSDGTYNILLGNNLRAEPGAPTTMPTSPLPWNLIMAIGEQIHSDLDKSLSVGFTGNRTTVTTERGLAVQLNPGALSTWSPTVNFEVDAAIAPSPGPMPTPSPIRSNIRFHNLPVMPSGGVTYPAVVIDPATGELFQTISTGYSKPGKGDAGDNLDELYEENEALKDRVSQLEAQLSIYDAKFAQLEKSLTQICESGCAGLNFNESDVLYQSIPNPSGNNAKINYYLSRNYSNASITVYSYDGREVNTYKLAPNQGDGSLDISLGDVQPGVYLYRLIVDGKPVDVKKLQKQ